MKTFDYMEEKIFTRRADKTPEALECPKYGGFEFCRKGDIIRQNMKRT